MNARLVALTALALSLAAAGAAPAAEPQCNPDPETWARVHRFDSPYDFLDLTVEQWQAALAEVDAALAERPNDLFLHRLRQDFFRYARKDVKEERMPAVREEYARLVREHPGDPMYLYLSSRVAEDSEHEAAANRAALEADPDFPWGHFGMIPVALNQEEPDKETAGRHLARFAEICPDNVDAILTFSRVVGSDEFWHDHLADLRRRMTADPAANAKSFPALWSLEFRQADVTEHDAVRERVAHDVEILATLEPRTRSVLTALKEGYELSGQSEEAAAVEAAMVAAFPCGRDSVYATMQAWEDEHPRPDDPDAKDEWTAWSRKLDEAARGWIERCPDEYHFWNQRLHALEALDDADPDEVRRVGERTAELYASWQGSSYPSAYEQVAKVFADKRIALDRALDLMVRGAEDTRLRRERRDLSGLPESQREALVHSGLVADWTSDALVARIRIARGELDQAQAVLDELAPRLEEIAPDEGSSGRAVFLSRGQESELWKLRADLAEAAGRLPDAFAYLIEAEAVRPRDSPSWVPGLRPADAATRIPDLWARLGGGEEALAALRASRAQAEQTAEVTDASGWLQAEGTLPPFELKDLSGRVWTAADLEGKTVFANAWATWCGPCREELPAVEALRREVAERDDVVVLTFNMDENTGAVVPFLVKEDYGFPVLFAERYLQDELKVFGIPKSWIIDGTGALRREQLGFDGSLSTHDWVAQVLGEMETVAEPLAAEAE